MTFINIKTAEQVDAGRLEAQAATIRIERNRRISETDYLVASDYPKKPDGILAYRQSLRDITDQAGFPESVEWPILGPIKE